LNPLHSRRRAAACLTVLATALGGLALPVRPAGATPTAVTDTLTVTATWAPLPPGVLPQSRTVVDGTPVRLDGNRLELSPAHLAAASLAWADGRSHAEALANYVGERFLDRRNTATATAYVTVDVAAGTRLGAVEVWAAGRNLTDRRDPVTESELGEGQYYRLPSRSLELGLAVGL